MQKRVTLPGYPLPLGVKLDRNGAQFSIFSRNATSVSLVIFDNANPDSDFTEYTLDGILNRTGDIWHIWVEGISEGTLYGYRIDGPYEPSEGLRFNKNKLLLDPYARAISGNFIWDLTKGRAYDPQSQLKDQSFSTEDNSKFVPKSIVINPDFDWFDRPLKLPASESIIYELHVRGFSQHTSANVVKAGTFKGLTEKIPYLKELGVTAVELLPIQEFDEFENVNINPLTGERLKNYWGYSTISFFSPKGNFSSSGTLGEQVYEFKEMVRDFHQAGIEVILDIVFNHTAEGTELGPTLNFRGIDNNIYYMLEDNKRFYKNYSGCGNTFNCNHPFVRDFILDCLKYWVVEMHVDGFRFDLASILGRDKDGNIVSNPPLIERIEEDPILRKTKIIAEAWDAAGAYQVGDFPGRWAEWNGKFRDDIRRFWRGDLGMTGIFATRLTGSSDLYYDNGRGPLNSINFLTAHDGFTINDLVCYKNKQNLINGENNRDGEINNYSENYGIEGENKDITPLIEKTRNKQIKNLLSTLFLSQGIPMLLSGDEFRRTQQGNNNAYCQDNEISWLDWENLETHKDIFDFTRQLIAFRKKHPLLRQPKYFLGKPHTGHINSDITWHGVKANSPDWQFNSRVLACTLNGEYSMEYENLRDDDLYMAFNASLYNIFFEIPKAPSGKKWLRVIDTSFEHPDDFCIDGCPIPFQQEKYLVKRQSVVVLKTEK